MFVRKKSSLFSLVILLLALTGCNNPKDVNKENFTKAINNSFKDSMRACINFDVKFPVQFQTEFGLYRNTSMDEVKVISQYEALADVGLLVLQKSEKTSGTGFDYRNNTTYIVNLTESGKKYFQPKKGFCYGDREVTEIVNFTEPTEVLGMAFKASQVNFKYQTKNLAPWINKLQQLNKIGVFPYVKADIDSTSSPVEKSTSLVLTNNGWIGYSDFEKFGAK
jgi:hypothetical protein